MVRQLVPLPSRGVSLEVDIHFIEPKSTSRSGLLLVVLHPWAWLGGCMDDHVVAAVCRSALDTRRFCCVVRYNMRGAGASGGIRALCTSVDAQDLVVLAHELLLQQQERQEQHPSGQLQQRPDSVPASAQPTDGIPAAQPRLVLVAYSYGSLVAARALPQLRPHVAAIAVLAPPIGSLGRVMLGAGSSWGALAGARSTVRDIPRLVCCGDRDQFVSVSQLRNAVQQALRAEAQETTKAAVAVEASAARATSHTLAGVATTTYPPAAQLASESTLELVLWPDCDHFFFDCRDAGALEAAGLLGRYGPGTTTTSPFVGGVGGSAGGGVAHGSRDRDGAVGRSVAIGRDNRGIEAAGCSTSASNGSCTGASNDAAAEARVKGREKLRPRHRVKLSKALAEFVMGWLLAKAAEPEQP
ncbi:hypothetical protein VaNZ11_006644 [Volvox africanus]|uniref:AB hydrolase-1 domain-containing protein n=1 Tax=Volvox africanus TaxID=51714 RepID=A0ABQ5S193_9CHLO|nr:hypothetical protein VaNZ11_006644 [Volvox africanus]